MTDPMRIVEVKEFVCPFCNMHASVQTKDVIVEGDRERGFGTDYWTCKTCGSENDIFDEIDFSRMKNMAAEQLSESDTLELFDFARHLIQKQEFEKAITIMQFILKHDPNYEQCEHLFAKVQKVLRLRVLIRAPIDFASVSEALEDHFGMNTYNLNIKTGKVDVISEWDKTLSRRSDSPGERIALLPMSSRKVFEKMKEFIGVVNDEKLKQELSSVLGMPHPFRRFKDALAAYNGETQYREMWFDIYNSFMWNEAVDYIIDALSRILDRAAAVAVIDGKTYPVVVEIRDVKVSTARIRNGMVSITVSSQLSEADRQGVVERLKKRMQQPRKTRSRFIEPLRKFENGEIIDLGAKKYSIRIDFDDKLTSSGRLVGNTIHLRIADGLPDDSKERHVYELVRKILSRDRQAALRRKLKELNRHHFNAHFKDVLWKRQMAQWGSCSENKYINVSYRLLFAPEDVLEYVCIHELAHLLEFNHSKRFWKLVRKAIPDYEEKERWLKENGGEIY